MRILTFLIVFTCSLHLPAQTDSLDHMIGQMIMVGIGDFNVLKKSEPVFQELAEGKVGGIILFEKNLSGNYTQAYLKEMIDYAQAVAPTPLFVSIDEEGGKVNRLKTKYGFPKTVSAQYLGIIDNPDSTRFYAHQTASTLKQLGINLNFAPILDVNVNPQNPIIGKIGRSFSSDHHKVTEHAKEVIKSHDELGVATAVKHFPGHGSSRNDTHLGIADVSDTWQLNEIFPYQTLIDSGLVRMVMTAHIVNRIVDANKIPATLSDQAVNKLLRDFLGYDGVVISDDLQMGAIAKEYGLEQSIEMCINAGVDILLFANNVPDSDLVTASQVHSIIRKQVGNGSIDPSRIKESYQRIIELKLEIGLLPE